MCEGCLDLRKAPYRRNVSLLMNVCIVTVHNMFDWSGTLREDRWPTLVKIDLPRRISDLEGRSNRNQAVTV